MESESQLEKVRSEAKRLIGTGEMTMGELARKVALSQPAISRFLSQESRLSWRTLDRMIAALHLTIQLTAPELPLSASRDFRTVPLVRQLVARTVEQVRSDQIIRPVFTGRKDLKLRLVSSGSLRDRWTRLVAVRPVLSQIEYMYPRITDRSILILDRHCQHVLPAHLRLLEVYAIDDGKQMSIGVLRERNGRFTLAPESSRFPSFTITLPPEKNPSHRMVGRVCLILQS